MTKSFRKGIIFIINYKLSIKVEIVNERYATVFKISYM